jgi:hypothetical protein
MDKRFEKTFLKRSPRNVQWWVSKRSILMIVREMQIKTTQSELLTPGRMAVFKKTKVTSADEDVEM